MNTNSEKLLRVKDLHTHFFTRKGVVKAVDGVSFELEPGRILGLVGESGAGKSITGFSILGLIDPPGRVVSGEISFKGRDLAKLPEEELVKIRGKQISMVFQDPQTSLDPVFTIGYQITEALKAHGEKDMDKNWARAEELLRMVGIPSPKERLEDYPHQFSGGMRQRVGIAIAMASNPSLIIADEPSTALDVTIQAQVLTLMRKLVKSQGASMILITHDIALVGQFCDEICVMYAGCLVEKGLKETVIRNPVHPYTQGLIASIPGSQERRRRLKQIPGIMPSLLDLPSGCPFLPRCELGDETCRIRPELEETAPGHLAACHKVGS
ncbi:ABC transporter ATP-binding protein [Dethiosulfatarculus sandiegensis]|uniref:Peptide ABC transporter substrate-binding protein n=1 Tax=Dethiosulfatarculus sandiegensis TaxID=1429043 RepID=A0A0D2HZS3_9BACT|nr:ABC transporter ATP-binding protein [Dethiosulfatarculus sandiegensis]KIX15783.1 peptide ABC transporter substrate-binding protein [Dethiosulfatarculus sandiegensis]